MEGVENTFGILVSCHTSQSAKGTVSRIILILRIIQQIQMHIRVQQQVSIHDFSVAYILRIAASTTLGEICQDVSTYDFQSISHAFNDAVILSDNSDSLLHTLI